MSKPVKPTYFEVLLEWNSGSEDSFKCPEEFKKKFKNTSKVDGEDKYIERRLAKIGETND